MCSCERSPIGRCVGWHKLTEAEYKMAKEKYDKLTEKEKEQAFHPRAIDGFGE